MQAPICPDNEPQRLKALHDLAILDSAPEERFDRLTRLARDIFSSPIALVSLVDAERQWFKSRQGLDACETGRDVSFCGHAILSNDIFVVADTHLDPRFADNPLVLGPPHLRFYAGAPLHAPDGHCIGTLCIMDGKPRQLIPSELRVLRDLADCVETEIDRSQAETALREQVDHTQAILHNMIDGIITIDATGVISSFSPAAERIFGYTEAEALGRNVRSLMPNPHRDAHDSYLHNYRTTGVARVIGIGREVEGLRKDGSLFPMELAVSKITRRGKTMYVGTVREITERKQAEIALREQAEHTQAILDNMIDGIITIDASGTVDSFSPAAERIFGYCPEEVLGKNVRMLMPNPHRDAHDSYLHNYQTTGEARVIGIGREVEGQRKDGSLFPMELAVSKITRQGKTMYVGTVREITERKQAEIALREQAEHTQAILDNMIDGIITIDTSGTVDSFSPAAERIFGYRPEEVLGQNVRMLMPNPHRDAHDSYLHNYRTTGVARVIGIGREVEGQRKDGSLFPMELAVSEITRQGKTMYVGTVRDITERKRVDRMKTEFVSTVSHELRTPLTAIAGSLGLIAGGALGELPANARKMITIAHKNSQRLNHLVNDLLDIEKLAAGKLHFEMEILPLMPLIEHALEANRGYGAERCVTMRLSSEELTAIEAHVRVDSQRLMQVMSNLLSNAIKYSPENDTVEITATQHAEKVCVTVTDRGAGIPAEFRSRIFQKFAQADSSDTRQKGGTGLGLAITKELVERMGGHIGFESVEGKGTSFFFELPLWDKNRAHDVIDQSLKVTAGAPRILVVEDEPDIAQLLALMLARAGYVADVATAGTQALDALQQSDYAAMTLDLALPDISGLEIIRWVRLQPKTANLPIVVVSAKMEEGRLAINGDFSAVDWLAKPIDEARLLDVLNNLMPEASQPSLRVLHVEDDVDLHTVVRAMIGERFDFELATTLAEARTRMALEHFDVVLLDLTLPDGSGWDLLPEIRANDPDTRIVILSGTDASMEQTARVDAVLRKSHVSPHALLDVLKQRIGHYQAKGNKS